MDLTQLQGLLAQFQPTEEDKKRAQMQALATAGFGLLGTRKGQEMQGLSRAGLLGMAARERFLNEAQGQRAQAMQNAGMAMSLQDKMRQQTEREQQQAADVRFNDTLANLPTGPTAGMQSLAPTQANAATMQQNADPVAQLNAKAELYEQAFRETKDPRFLQMAAAARKEALANRDENQGFETVIGPDGPKLVQRRKFGAPQEMPYGPKPDMQLVDSGGTQAWVDKLRTPAGTSYNKTLTPGERQSGYFQGENLKLARNADARAASGEVKPTWDSASGQWQIPPRAGQPAQSITPQGFTPKQPESSRKELASLDAQSKTVQTAIAMVKQTPSAFSAMRGAATMAGAVPETMAGRFNTPEERETRSYVYNIVSKVINERAGAAQSVQELARLRSFLPAEMDNAEQITDKLNAFQKYIDDQSSAYGGAPKAAGQRAAGGNIRAAADAILQGK